MRGGGVLYSFAAHSLALSLSSRSALQQTEDFLYPPAAFSFFPFRALFLCEGFGWLACALFLASLFKLISPMFSFFSHGGGDARMVAGQGRERRKVRI